jgi:hypothetical protein
MTTAVEAFDRMFDLLVGCFTPDVAEKVANLRADSILQARLDELADKCTEGELTPDERAEYEAYVRAIDMIAIVMAKARKLLRQANSS